MEPNDELESSVNVLATQAASLEIVSHTACEQAARFLRELKSMKEKVHETMDPICEAARTTWKTAVAARDKHLAPLEEAEGIVKRKISTWTLEQERQRLEVQRAAQAAAEAKEREQIEKEAAALRALGNEKAAEELVATPIVVTVNAPPPCTKIAGMSTQIDWDIEIVDAAAVPREYCVPNEVMIRKVVKATKGQISIAGVKAIKKTIVKTRG